MSDLAAEMELAARYAVALVEDGMVVGLGTGSTAGHAIRLLGMRVREEGLRISGVPTSPASSRLAAEVGVPLIDDTEAFALDLAIDGADRATRAGYLIKGGGGALLRERIVAAAAKRFVVIGDSTKLVDRLHGYPVAIEVYRFGWRNAAAHVEALGGSSTLRAKDGVAYVTAEGNFIVDCEFSPSAMSDPHRLANDIRSIAGVADYGLFLDMAHEIVVARGDDLEVIACR